MSTLRAQTLSNGLHFSSQKSLGKVTSFDARKKQAEGL